MSKSMNRQPYRSNGTNGPVSSLLLALRQVRSGRLAGRVGIMSGGGRRGGSSQATARLLAEEGAWLMLVDLNPIVLEFAKEVRESKRVVAARGIVQAVVGDLTEPATANRAVAECVQRFASLDFVLNVAGGSDPTLPVTCEMTRSNHYWLLFQKNFITANNLTTAALPHLKLGSGRRDLVFFSTTNGTPGWPWAGEPALAASKAAVEAATRCWASELRPHGISVNCFRPASIPNLDSPVWGMRLTDPRCRHRMRQLYRVWGPLIAEQVAAEVAHLVDPKSAPRTGQIIPLDPSGIGELGTDDPPVNGKWWLPVSNGKKRTFRSRRPPK